MIDVPETRYVRADDGVHIAYQVFGDGPYDLVVNDGWVSNVDANWLVPVFADGMRAYARRARVITFDRRGFGVSDRPTSPGAMSLEKGMDDMRAVMDAVGVERAVLLGTESGCAVSVMFAASFPERTVALVLISPLVYSWKTPDFPWGNAEAEARVWMERLEQSWGTEAFWRWNFDAMGYEADDDEVRAVARWSRLSASPQAAMAVERVEREVDVRPLLLQIRVPTLVALKAGDRDKSVWGAAPWVAEQIPGARYLEVPGGGHIISATDHGFFEELDRFVAGVRLEEAELDRVLATVMFTDIVGSTDRAAALGDRAWRELVERHHGIVRSMLARYRGVEVDTAGDGFLATFDGPARAVRCVQAIVEALKSAGIEIRAGVHTGEVETIDGKVGGIAVVIGARIGALAGASEVLVSQTVKDLVAGSGLAFEDAGEHELKGIPERWRVYRAVR